VTYRKGSGTKRSWSNQSTIPEFARGTEKVHEICHYVQQEPWYKFEARTFRTVYF